MGQVNMVAEAVYYMKSICSSINSDNIGILIQLIDTLNEMAVVCKLQWTHNSSKIIFSDIFSLHVE